AFERHRREGRFGGAEHRRVEGRRGLLSDRILRIRHAGEIGAFAVEDRDGPVLARTLLLDHGLENLDRRTERDVVENLAVANDGHFDRHDQPLLYGPEEQVGIDWLLFREDPLHNGEVVAWRQACGVWRDGGKTQSALRVR